jgi:two-component system nitrate/nitrite sensor histidine kinase NarX
MPTGPTHPPHSGSAAAPPRSRVLQILRTARLAAPFAALAGGLLGAVLLLLFHWWQPHSDSVQMLCLGFLATSLGALVVSGIRLRTQLLLPLVNLENTVGRVSQGEPGASESLQNVGVLDDIARDIGTLNAELTDLYEDMDSRVARQTMRLAQKTASIKILYDVAAGINEAESLDDLLLRFLRVLKEMVNGRAATVRLVMADGSRRLVGSIGLDDDLVNEHDMAPVDLCLCGNVLSPGDILCSSDERFCSRIYGRRMFRSDEIEVVTVPLEHHDELLGLYSIFVDRPGIREREDIMELLFSIGHHLGIAVAKHRSDADARRLSIMEERNSLAHELHDSLAQTLASLRFQVNLLGESLEQLVAIPESVKTDIGRVRSGLDEAHTELRSLLASFRAPMDRRGLVPTLEKLTERFGQRTGLHVLFQNNCRSFELPAATELQVTRIAQEALANIHKHARAHTVRVLLTRVSGGEHVLLVEDDGIGFRLPEASGKDGEHIGLSIMRERARRIGAELRIESEPEEGTRVELQFSLERRAPVTARVAA